MATPMPGRPPPRGKPLRVSPYGLHPPRLAAHLWTYTTSWDINPEPTTSGIFPAFLVRVRAIWGAIAMRGGSRLQASAP